MTGREVEAVWDETIRVLSQPPVPPVPGQLALDGSDSAASKPRCRFGRPHVWVFEYDLEAECNTGWVSCPTCGAREWEGVDQ